MNILEPDRRSVIGLAAGATLLPLISDAAAPRVAPEAQVGLGRAQSFNQHWQFYRGTGTGFEAPTLNDGNWRVVDLPHDWSIEDVPGGKAPRQVGPFDRDSVGGTATGFTDGGEGWYRKHFHLAALPASARVELEFDGITASSEVWLNGVSLGEHFHGYTPFAYDLTPHLRRDGDNVIAVRVRNLGENSRWYAGSGIYRDVTITVLPTAAGVTRWGVGAWTRRIADGIASVDVTTQLEAGDAAMVLTNRLRNAQGRIVAEASGAADAQLKQTLSVPAALLWSPDAPNLYVLETELKRGATVLDTVTQPFGIRIVTMDAKNGMRINDKSVRLRGGCIHHDNGLLGAAAFSDADERRVRLLKARGFNAIRSSHNPASSSLRLACDKLGMLLIEESFDMWHVQKLKDDYSNHIRQDWKAALTAMVLSARNSPSVIMWSIGNEIPDRSSVEGVEWSWKFANEVRTLDPTRPVTAGLNGVLGTPLVASEKAARIGFAGRQDEASTVFLDVAGYNYKLEDIESDHKLYPDRVIYASETFPADAYDYQALIEKTPYFLGEFVWTAMDYLGEAGIGATARISVKNGMYIAGFPWVNAWCGDIDLIGDQKPQSLARDVTWGLSPLEILVQKPIPDGQKEFVSTWGWRDELPIWTWPNADAKPLAVRFYTAGDSVKLTLNGKLIGTRYLTAADKQIAEFAVAYEPGTLEGVAFRNGREIARKRIDTVGPAVGLRLAAERKTGGAGRDGLSYVSVTLVDASGRTIPDADTAIQIAVSGPAQLIGFGSANPLAVGSFQSPEARLFRGRALAILRATGAKGAVRVEVRSRDLKGSSATITLT